MATVLKSEFLSSKGSLWSLDSETRKFDNLINTQTSYPIIVKLSQTAPGIMATDWRSYRPFGVLKYRLMENRDFWPIAIFELDKPFRRQVVEISENQCQHNNMSESWHRYGRIL